MKKYRALVSFCTKTFSASKGQSLSLDDKDSAPLLVCGYIEEISEKTKKVRAKKNETK